MNKDERDFAFAAGIIAFVGVSLSCFFPLVQGWGWTDFPGQWRSCAYVLRGVDHYPYIGAGNIPDAVKDIGIIPATWNAVPWGTVLGNVFYFGL
ncbi:MAG: hypothetical protein IJG37_00335 [Synergistaceae bacterium]|nr:hypothetical protein [Synergistaceae bacterium]MBQ4431086.1 hypothetical protein [Synergistaceae bacterium]MBQ6970874.1 hypothetical protein [Synergistaceae bacterium]